jgi:hypothetical protein
MNTMNLLLGNSEQLLNNFIQILVQDACADEGIVTSTSVRTVEGLILQGLTGRFDLVIVIPNNLVPDGTSTRAYDAFAEAGEAIQILKKRCGMPILVAAAFGERTTEEPLLWRAGADRVLELPFRPDELAGAVRDLLKRGVSAEKGNGGVCCWGAFGAFNEVGRALDRTCSTWFGR